MKIKKRIVLSVVAGLFLVPVVNANEIGFAPIGISALQLDNDEKSSTTATEVFTKKDIEESKAKDIYDFLGAQSSVNIMPSFGNEFSQKIDLRGYGVNDGYENIVVVVDGRRLNNIDMAPQLLAAIPLESVEKIEILKGSGSVLYGDGANAGVINIKTNGKNRNYIKTYFGNNGQKNGTVSLGYSNEKVILNAFVDYTSSDGDLYLANGETNDNYNKNKNINLKYFPTDDLELKIGRSFSNMNTKYGNPISKAQYEKDPSLTSAFNTQYLSSYITTLGASYNFSHKYSLDVDFFDEDKIGNFPTWKQKYNTKQVKTKFKIKSFDYVAVVGIDVNNADKSTAFTTVDKDSKAIYFSADYNLAKDWKVNFGARRENIEYTNTPNTGNSINKDLGLNAFTLGLNYSLNKNSSLFATFNRSFQAPVTDRFFKGNNFNGFIEPAKVNNFTLGYNNIRKNNKLKLAFFRSNLKNEIYYYKDNAVLANSINTNIDKSHKYGVEFFDKYQINKNLFTSINYSYIIAKIDEENEANGAYNGKDLPGVSKHNLTLNVGYNYNSINTIISHTYRSSAYALNDFTNSATQKQEAYHSTDVSVSYKYKNYEVFGKVKNLLDVSNALWTGDDSIYPVNFTRTFYAGVKVNF